MRSYLTILLLFINSSYCMNMVCGCGPSKANQVTAISNTTSDSERSITRVDPVEEKDSPEIVRKRKIAASVEKMPIAQIVFHHKRVTTVDYDRHHVKNQDDIMVFRAAVKERYKTLGEDREMDVRDFHKMHSPRRTRSGIKRNNDMILMARNHPPLSA